MKMNFKVSIPVGILITLIAIIYQRTTGPTYPKKFTIQSSLSGEKLRVKLPRSQETTAPASIEIPTPSGSAKAEMFFRRYPTNDAWTRVELTADNKQLVATLPIQPPAGKLEYYINLVDGDKTHQFGTQDEPIVIRYKGAVPIWILAPHVFCMFMAMLFSGITMVEAFYKTEKFYFMSLITTGFLLVGGMGLGPLVQKNAFGVYWAGFPYGMDLTDNKLLIGAVAWVLACLLSLKKRRAWASIAAAMILIIVYSIPHSRRGSEFDHNKGKVVTQDKY